MSRSRTVPWHRSLSVRLFALGAVIALLAVAAATWATVRATTVAVQEEQQESFHADAQIYDALMEYAATHRSWAGAGSLVRRLGRQHEGPVTLTDPAGQVILSSDGSLEPVPPGQARASIDALDVDTALLVSPPQEAAPVTGPTDCGGTVAPAECLRVTVATTLTMDPRIDGPFDGDDRTAFVALQRAVRSCLRAAGLSAQITLLVDLSVVVATSAPRRRSGRRAG